MRARAARVNDALRDPLVIEVRDLLAQDEVFEQRGTAQSGLERVLVVGDRDALVGGQHLARGIGTYSIERVDGRVDTGAGRGARLVAGVALRQRAGADSRRGRRYMSAFRRVVACVQAEGPGQVTGLIDGRHSLVDRGRLVGERIAVGRRRRRGWPAGRAPSSGLGVWGRSGRSGFRLLHVVCLSRCLAFPGRHRRPFDDAPDRWRPGLGQAGCPAKRRENRRRLSNQGTQEAVPVDAEHPDAVPATRTRGRAAEPATA